MFRVLQGSSLRMDDTLASELHVMVIFAFTSVYLRLDYEKHGRLIWALRPVGGLGTLQGT